MCPLFGDYKGWLEKHDCYEAIVDGANIGLYQQDFADGGFSINQVCLCYMVLYPFYLLSIVKCCASS
jgi:proteinaceous RNase P